MLGPLAKNGGLTQTHALLPGSLAINAGDNGLLPLDVNDLDGDGNTREAIPFEQRGVGFDRVIGAGVDMGAVEMNGDFDDPSLIVTTTEDTLNFSDGRTSFA